MFRLYFMIGGLVLLLSMIGGAYFYYTSTQNKIQTLIENNTKLESAVNTQSETISNLLSNQEKINRLNNELTINLQISESSRDKLLDTLHKHNLTNLSIKKPGLIEKRINDGTKKVFKNLESITGNVSVE